MNYRTLKKLTEQAEALALPLSKLTVCQNEDLALMMGTDSLEAAYMLADIQGVIWREHV